MLAVFPIALLFLTVPHSTAIVQLIRGFQQIANEGLGGMKVIAPYCLGIPRSLRLGAIGLLATMGVAAALQARGRHTASQAATSENVLESQSSLRTWILAASSMLILPVGFEMYLSDGIPQLIMRVAPRAERITDLTSAELAQVSGTITTQILLTVLYGATLSAILVAFGVANLITVRRGRASHWVLKYSWLMLMAACVLACWIIVRTTAQIHSFERLLG